MWTSPPPLTTSFHVHTISVSKRRIAVQNRRASDVTVKSNGTAAKSMSNTKQTASKERESEEEEDEQREKQLSGSAILMALERATAQKSKKQREKKGDVSVSRVRKTGEPDFVNNDVRALCIKPEWSDRLVELEKRLEDLIHG